MKFCHIATIVSIFLGFFHIFDMQAENCKYGDNTMALTEAVKQLGLRLDDTQSMLMRPQKEIPVNLSIPHGVKRINGESHPA